MLHLLNPFISKTEAPCGIEWPPLLIYKAAWLGLDRFADKILGLGCPPDPEVAGTQTLRTSSLFQASRAGHAKTVWALLKHAANRQFAGGLYGRTLLHPAAVEGHTEVAQVLLEDDKAEIDAASDHNYTPLYLVLLFGRYRTLELLLNKGADTNMCITPGPADAQWVPLVVASDDGLEKYVRLLQDNGTDPDICGPNGTPLRRAACSGHLEACNMLLAAGADPKSELLEMPLLHQIFRITPESKLLEILDLFLEPDLDINVKNKNGDTVALHAWPARVEDFRVVFHEDQARLTALPKFLDYGGDPNIPNNGGNYPLWLAVARRKRGVVELLLQSYLTESVELLLEHNESIDMEYDGESEHWAGWTALRFAATTRSGKSGIVRRLAEAGADLKHKAKGIPVARSTATGKYLQELLEFSARIDIN